MFILLRTDATMLLSTIEGLYQKSFSFDAFPEAKFLDWAIDPETGKRYHENRLRFNMELFDDEFSGTKFK